MADPMLAFQGILHERLIPEYYQGDFLKSGPAEFKPTPLHFGAEDARYFGMAWKAGLISHVGGGKYNAPRNAAAEKFFNAGPRSQFPRTRAYTVVIKRGRAGAG